MHHRQMSAGYSLYELLMTLGIAVVVLGLGIPSLGGLVADKRLRVETDALFHAVHRARQESIVRRRVVTLCPSADGIDCDAQGRWSLGWILFANIGRTGLDRRDDAEALLHYHEVDDSVTLLSNRGTYSFRSTDQRATNGTLLVCDRSARAVPRAVVVSYTGRPRVSGSDSRGEPWACAD